MATDKPRITISLDPQTHEVYKRFAKLAGQPTATVISNILDEGREHIIQLGVLLQQSQELVNKSAPRERAAFLARLDVAAHRSAAAAEFIGADLVQMAQVGAAAESGAAKPRKRSAAAQSLIHTNKSPKSMPTRVPAGKVQQKRGGKRAST